MDKAFYIAQSELTLRFSHGEGARKLSFAKSELTPQEWQVQTKQKLSGLLGLELPTAPGMVQELRKSVVDNVAIAALTMTVSNELSIPAYLLMPQQPENLAKAVVAIHGHGEVEPCIGAYDDYHHSFALELAKSGHIVMDNQVLGEFLR